MTSCEFLHFIFSDLTENVLSVLELVPGSNLKTAYILFRLAYCATPLAALYLQMTYMYTVVQKFPKYHPQKFSVACSIPPITVSTFRLTCFTQSVVMNSTLSQGYRGKLWWIYIE